MLQFCSKLAVNWKLTMTSQFFDMSFKSSSNFCVVILFFLSSWITSSSFFLISSLVLELCQFPIFNFFKCNCWVLMGIILIKKRFWVFEKLVNGLKPLEFFFFFQWAFPRFFWCVLHMTLIQLIIFYTLACPIKICFKKFHLNQIL